MGASRSLPVIVVEHPVELLLTSDAAHRWKELWWLDEFIRDSLVVAPVPIIAAENREGFSEVVLTEEDKATQTLLLDRAYKSFRIGIALRNPRRAEHDFHTG